MAESAVAFLSKKLGLQAAPKDHISDSKNSSVGEDTDRQKTVDTGGKKPQQAGVNTKGHESKAFQQVTNKPHLKDNFTITHPKA